MLVTNHGSPIVLVFYGRSKFPITAIEPLDLWLERRRCSAIVDDIICSREPFFARKLRCHDRADGRREKPTPRYNAADLQLFGAIDNEYAFHAGQKTAPFEKQRHDENAIDASPCLDGLMDRRDDERMERTFETVAKYRIGERALAEPAAIKRTVGLQAFRAEGIDDCPMAALSGRRKRVCDIVGVEHVRIESREHRCDLRFAATDAAGQSHDVTHVK
jgi:hypothetical protein